MDKANLVGQRFNSGVVVEELHERDNSNKVRWKLLCDCGEFYNSTTQSLKQNISKNCGCVAKGRIVGKTIYNKTVIRYAGSNGLPRGKGLSSTWECRCVCGETFIAPTSKVMRKCDPTACGCGTRKMSSFTSDNSKLRMAIKNYISKTKAKTKYRDSVEFHLTLPEIEKLYEKQNRKCAISGIDIAFESERTASFDRIDPQKHYTIDNVHLVHKVVNFMKWIFSYEEFINWCHIISANNKHIPITAIINNKTWDRWADIIKKSKQKGPDDPFIDDLPY